MMIQPKRPMLAPNTCVNIDDINYPVLATPKVDGLRCLTLPTTEKGKRSKQASRSYKTYGNLFVREWMERRLMAGLDGELIVVDENERILPFNDLSGQLRRSTGEPNFRFMVFDTFRCELSLPYTARMEWLDSLRVPSTRVIKLLPTLINNRDEMDAFEKHCVDDLGHEGAMVRSLDGPYKENRATLKEGYLLKVKRFEDNEGWVIGAVESQENQNEQEKDAFGNAKRSSHSGNMKGKGYVGSLILKPKEKGRPTDEDYQWVMDNGVRLRQAIQKHDYYFGANFASIAAKEGNVPMGEAADLCGRLITYRWFPTLDMKKPRFPQLKGWRDPEEIGL